jgi:hypothetical protein
MRKQTTGSVFHHLSLPISFCPWKSAAIGLDVLRSKNLRHQLREGMNYFVVIGNRDCSRYRCDPRLPNVAEGMSHIIKNYGYDSISVLADDTDEAILHGER